MIYTKSHFKNYQKIREEEVKFNLANPRKKDLKYYIKYYFFKLLSRNTKLSENRKNLNNNTLLNLLNIDKILLLRYDVIGDYIVSTSLINFIKSINPNVKIDIVVTDRNKILADNDPNIDKFYLAPHSKNINFKYFRLKDLRKNDYDICISLVTSKNTKAAIITKLCAPHSIKISMYDTGNHEIYGLFFNRMIKYFVPATTWTQKMLNMGKLCFENFQKNSLNETPYTILNKKSIEKVNNFTNTFNLNYKPNLENVVTKDIDVKNTLVSREGREYVIFNIAGSKINKILQKENIVNIITPIAKEYSKIQFFITGGKDNLGIIQNVIKDVNLDNIRMLDEDLITFFGILIGAKLLISPDTSTIHVAATAKVPEVVLFSKVGFLYEWFPYQTNFIPILAETDENINSIPAEEVRMAIKIFLKNEESDLIFDKNYFVKDNLNNE